jgi:hypothetical protein
LALVVVVPVPWAEMGFGDGEGGCDGDMHCHDHHLYQYHYVGHHTLDSRDGDVERDRVFSPTQVNEIVGGTGLAEIW